MVDVSKISGPGSASDPFSGKEPLNVNPEKFRKHIEETDTEQKKKQKKPQKDVEDLEDEAEEAIAARPSPQEQPSLDIKFPKEHLIKEVEKTDERQKKQEKRPEETPHETKREETMTPIQVEKPPSFKSEDSSTNAPPKTPFPKPFKDSKESVETEMERDFTPPQPLLPPQQPIEEKEDESISEERVGSSAPQPEKSDEKKVSTPKEGSSPSSQTSPGPFFLPPSSAAAPGYSLMKPEVFQLFEHMVMAITVMNESGLTETTIHLNSSDFSLFAGAQIVIKEYSTAPKAFNVEFLGNAQNTAAFLASAEGLVAAVNTAHYNFKINRVETSLLSSERPLFHRKEKPGEKGEKDSQGEPR